MDMNELLKNMPKIDLSQIIPPHPMLDIKIPELPEFRYEDSPRYVMDKQLEEIQTLNHETREQNKILIQNYNQLRDSFDLQKEQLEETKKQNNMLQEQLDNETAEKEAAVIREKKAKPWGVVGKILSAVIAFIAFAITLIATIYPEKCRDILEILFSLGK